ncbi:response regulator [Sphingomonas sp. CGMCC 1.13654]|uniref:Response regulator n=1 Tax=Sphingomonas chungangi TaxID=2683589 RepID=A0A838L9K5_9SPHN|nr:response regulator [Sphingomonas chungangi]MBA2935395.1 response regulator [Sphingomonas chungangi]MVW56901.1 response regulator [Sphingomonas chungangi]
MNEPLPPRLLVVDDDSDLRELIAGFLRDHHIDVETAADAESMDAALARQRYDCVILDLMMPGEDGLSVLRRMRGRDRTPVIMLSAMGEDVDRIVGLEVGADDYLSKPCNPRELLARVRALLRRTTRGDEVTSLQGGSGNTPRRRFGDWSLDLVERTLFRQGYPAAPLTDAEFRVMTAFLDRPQRVLSRDTLIELAKGSDADVFDRAIDVTISRLRKKLGPGDPIRTIRNEGYMLSLKPEEG